MPGSSRTWAAVAGPKGSKPVVRNSHVHWTVEYKPGTIEARGSKNGQVALVERRETTGAPAKIVLRASLSKIAADGQDVSAIAVELRDSQDGSCR